ncbi:MAG: type II toxin-antitoxin system RelE/ParE family toxin [Thermodesulfobacteriota bacterium]
MPTPPRYRLAISPSASRSLRNLPSALLPAIARRIDLLAGNPRPLRTKKLSGKKGTYRVRAGDYRILYSVDDRDRVVTVLDVALRAEVYKKR